MNEFMNGPKGWQAKPGLGRAYALAHATRWILQLCCEQANLVFLNTDFSVGVEKQ